MHQLLGVNLDHVATVRQARYAGLLDQPNAEPDILQAALAAQAGGADSLTIHVREDRRHMQAEDAFRLKREQGLPINLEMAVTPEMVALAVELKPEFVCLVPEKREELTTEGGLDVVSHRAAVADAVKKLQVAGIRVSLFIDPDHQQIEQSAAIGAEMIELHTGAFANAFDPKNVEQEVDRLAQGAELGRQLGLQVNAGHGINYLNIRHLDRVPHLSELNIGHSIIARAVFVGLESAVREMKQLMSYYPQPTA